MNENILLSPHFKLSEFEVSQKAKEHGIANVAPPEAVENLRKLCEGCLEPLREAMCLPIVITSGYRCKALNDLLAHSSTTSQHMRGEAADFYIGPSTSSGTERRELLIRAFRQIITDDTIDFDQLILYPTFIHVSYVSREKNRRKLTKANGQGTYCALTREAALSIV